MAGGGQDWWASLRHGGLLIAPSKLREFFPVDPPTLGRREAEALRRALTRVEADAPDAERLLLETVLETVSDLDGSDGARWERGADVGREWSHRALSGETVRPRAIWYAGNAASFPVFVDTKVQRLGIGHGRKATSRVVEWLRGKDSKLALLTNLKQWRLIHAGLDHDAWAEWDADLWFEEGEPGPQVTALRALISRNALAQPSEREPPRLIAAIQASRKGQAELSSELGERVRRAVELLIQEHGKAFEKLVGEGRASERDIYIATTRIVMRMVVILFAEARDLLPRDNRVYHEGYGLQGLREALERSGGASALERLRHRYAAWPRVLGLFRLVHDGSHHEALPVPRYGGDLFRPGDLDSTEPLRRAIAVLENPEHAPSDEAVYLVLRYLCRSRVKVRQGKSATWIEAPVDFSDLSSEYIGILYEGLLDFELRQAKPGDPMIFLGLGDEPALPLSRLEGMSDKELSGLVEKLKVKKKASAGEEDDDADEEADGEESDEDEVEEESPREEPASEVAILTADDERHHVRARAARWAARAVAAGKLVPRPRSKKPVALAEYEQKLAAIADGLIRRVVLPREWYLIRWGGTRKGAGTFYTGPQVATPIVHRALRPLAFEPPLGEDGRPDEEAAASAWTPKTPESILRLKVCDPAMGSGSFLVAGLRFLTDALVSSLHRHGRLKTVGETTVVTLAEGKPSDGSLADELLPCRPEDDGFDARLRGKLRRHIVERCIYGVDIDPLAVELARLSLWVETMDRDLPFEFLDHKLKCGNSLVGAWFDRFRDYPLLSWERKSGDEAHPTGIHFEAGAGARAIKTKRTEVKAGLLELLVGQREFWKVFVDHSPEQIHDGATNAIESMHALAVHQVEDKERLYSERIGTNAEVFTLRHAMDRWCAIWFWPADRLDVAPTPFSFDRPDEATLQQVERLAQEYRFFHWELEFPDVFKVAGGGFDAVVGNPPWETQKPNSKEYFSNLDPLYRTYGKQEALGHQREYFKEREYERGWLAYVARFKALSNWCKNAGSPFGDGADGGTELSFGRGNETMHVRWSERRTGRVGYGDPKHPFRYQGSADINTYKMFLEQSHALLRTGGELGMLVPSGVYTDKGSSDLRELFLSRSRLRFLYSFQNERFVFQKIHHSFKQVVLFVQKAASPTSFRAVFRVGPGDSPEAEEVERDLSRPERGVLFSNELVQRFSPKTRSLLEIRTDRDLEVLEKIYTNSVLLGDDGPDGWGIKYATEFHMTNDSKLFPPRPEWEAKGYKPDEYGRWIDPSGDVALPLMQGIMVQQYDFSAKGWLSGTGLKAKWRNIPFERKVFEPQFLVGWNTYFGSGRRPYQLKVGFRDIARTTDSRTMIASLLPGLPCSNKVPTLELRSIARTMVVVGLLNSFVFDWHQRLRQGGATINLFLLEEAPLVADITKSTISALADAIARLNMLSAAFAPYWMSWRSSSDSSRVPWRRLWAVSLHERTRLAAVADAIGAECYGLSQADLRWLLRDCSCPVSALVDKQFRRSLDPKGFWRVALDIHPELRHAILTQIAFHDLKGMIDTNGGDRDAGIAAFCNQNDGEGWMLPETLRLADYGLGHDERAKHAQPVASRLGPRFYDWQLAQTVEESWAECERHARNILGEEGFERLQAELRGEKVAESSVTAEAKLKSQPELFPWSERKGQGDLFGDG